MKKFLSLALAVIMTLSLSLAASGTTSASASITDGPQPNASYPIFTTNNYHTNCPRCNGSGTLCHEELIKRIYYLRNDFVVGYDKPVGYVIHEWHYGDEDCSRCHYHRDLSGFDVYYTQSSGGIFG